MKDVVAWLDLADYEAAKDEATTRVVARFSRGNISTQNGFLLDDADLLKLSEAGDIAMAKIQGKIAR